MYIIVRPWLFFFFEYDLGYGVLIYKVLTSITTTNQYQLVGHKRKSEERAAAHA